MPSGVFERQRRPFTVKQLDALKAGDSRFELWEGRGLGVRVGTTGAISWVLVCHDPRGRSRRFVLGRYPALGLADARIRAEEYRKAVAAGEDPDAERKAERQRRLQAPTVGALIDEYLDRYARPRKRSWRNDQLYLDNHVRPAWGNLKAEDIRRRDVVALLDQVAETAPVGANRLFAIVRRMFGFAVERDILEHSPCSFVKAPSVEQARDRVLTDDEIRALWGALSSTRPPGVAFDEKKHSPLAGPTAIAIKLLLTTAQRVGEVAGMEWAEVDLDAGWWTVPAARSKNKLAHRVPLTKTSVDLLKLARSYRDDTPFVFPGRQPHSTGPRAGGPVEPIKSGVANYGLRRTREKLSMEHFTCHDLRRTVATHMTSAGVPRLVVAKILNHAERSVTARYDRASYDAEKREAMELWERDLAKIVAGKNGGQS